MPQPASHGSATAMRLLVMFGTRKARRAAAGRFGGSRSRVLVVSMSVSLGVPNDLLFFYFDIFWAYRESFF